ncbi:methyltransferase domain-containing protein [Jeotgalibaca caeni]|uniref:methyltransferase domain-containing protein n=1 Tax=Jeotgalibaca caeni TaxID=3028623 RepID=UPI00237D9443|nr:methyltransferase domain-containing protein [Jeotgalibaca caeni]MDE1548361.1 methyltransferase domain-containing protein [Jeotgalibaca caeni]
MKKIEQSSLFLAEHIHLFQCPVCQQPFIETKQQGILCQKGHQFDLAKKGTLHLLQKGGQNEYDKAMLTSRKQLADTGFFHPLLDEILTIVGSKERTAVLDVGCGEGSHLHYLNEQGLGGEKIGFDISKDAIQLAANHYFEDAFWCVADLAHSPFSKEQFDLILNIFSPSHYQEFERLLKQGGQVVKVVPDSDYLMELRQQLYANEEKQAYENKEVVNRFKEIYPDGSHHHVRYEVPLTPESYGWLLEMTPLSWGADEAVLAKASQAPLASITVAVSILVGTKK